MVSLEFFIDIILLAALWPWGLLSLEQKIVPGIFPWGQRWLVRRADNLTTFTCQLPWNLGASTPWNPQGLYRPVMGLLYLHHKLRHHQFLLHPSYRLFITWHYRMWAANCINKNTTEAQFMSTHTMCTLLPLLILSWRTVNLKDENTGIA